MACYHMGRISPALLGILLQLGAPALSVADPPLDGEHVSLTVAAIAEKRLENDALEPPDGLHVVGTIRYPETLKLTSVVRDETGEFNLLAGPTAVAVAGDIAYATSMLDHALTIFDVSDPANPFLIRTIRDEEGDFQLLQGAWGVECIGTTLYVTSVDDDSLTILDVSNPSDPQLLSSIHHGDGEFHRLDEASGLVVKDGIAYVVSHGSGSLTIIDVSDPTNPELLSEVFDGAGDFNFMRLPWNVAVEGNYAYVASCGDDSLNIIDVSNPCDPTLISVITDGVDGFDFLNCPRGLTVKDGIAYVAAGDDDAVCIIDLSNPINPSLISVIRDDVAGFTHLDGAVATGLVKDHLAIASRWDGSLTLADINNPSEPRFVAAVQDGVDGFYGLAEAIGLFSKDQYVYVAARLDYAINIIDTGAIHVSVRADEDLSVWGDVDSQGRLSVNGAPNPDNLPLVAGTDATNGNRAYVSPGGVWTNSCDEEKKDSFQAVDSSEFLERVVRLPVQKWRYHGAPGEGFHVGPTAQDFHAQFGLGQGNRSIATVDADGVVLLSIQELYWILNDMDEQLSAQQVTLSDLEAINDRLRCRLGALEAFSETGSWNDELVDPSEFQESHTPHRALTHPADRKNP